MNHFNTKEVITGFLFFGLGLIIGLIIDDNISKNLFIKGYTVQVKYQTNSLGEVKIVSKNWIKNEK